MGGVGIKEGSRESYTRIYNFKMMLSFNLVGPIYLTFDFEEPVEFLNTNKNGTWVFIPKIWVRDIPDIKYWKGTFNP